MPGQNGDEMKINTIALAALAAATLAATPANATVDYVTNGGFDTVSNDTHNFEVSPGNTYGSVTGWSTASTPSGNPYNILFHSSIATSSVSGNALGQYQGTGKEYLNAVPSGDHGNFMALDGDTDVNGTFFTMLTGLTIGAVYDLTFDWASGQIASRTGATTEGLNVQVGGLNLTLPDRNTPSGGSTPWATVSAQFTATSVNQKLSFLAVGAPNGLPPVALLDNVSVRAAVPEPATWAMMLVGFGAIGLNIRRRRRSILANA